jgi:DNA-directed RNA polymerase subunit RPC12/RpoP
MTRKQAEKEILDNFTEVWANGIIKALEQKPRKGEWLRMSDLSEQEDDRYKCSRCGNVIHHKNKMNLYTFNSWCGRCGSDNGRHINYEVEE